MSFLLDSGKVLEGWVGVRDEWFFIISLILNFIFNIFSVVFISIEGEGVVGYFL